MWRSTSSNVSMGEAGNIAPPHWPVNQNAEPYLEEYELAEEFLVNQIFQ